jgi:hypothetical protein
VSLINDADPHRTILRILIVPVRSCAGLTCGKQDAQVAHDPHGGADNPRNPGRNWPRRATAERTCTLIAAA